MTLETWQACVHPSDRGRAADRLIEAIVTQASYQDEFRIVAFDDRVRWLRSLGVTVVDPAGKGHGATFVVELPLMLPPSGIR